MSTLNAGSPIVEADGTMSQAFRQWALKAGLGIPITGEGSPEGVVTAPQFSVYLDTAGGSGTIQFRKMKPAIDGDPKKGWVLV